MSEGWEFFHGLRPNEAVIVCCSGEGILLGRITVRVRRHPVSIHRYAEIAGLAVAESHRRRGIGGELVRLAMAWAKENGFERVAVEASAKEPRSAVAFYRSVGFTERSIILDREV